MTTSGKIPQRSVYKAAEVCAIAKVQPYVLRSWEAEFPDLGVERSGTRLRVYRRVDLDRVLRIKELLFVEGLTLGAARRKILKEVPAADEVEPLPFEELLGADARARVEGVKAGLQAILAMLSESSNGDVLPESGVTGGAASAGSVRRPVSKKAARGQQTSVAGGKRRRPKA